MPSKPRTLGSRPAFTLKRNRVNTANVSVTIATDEQIHQIAFFLMEESSTVWYWSLSSCIWTEWAAAAGRGLLSRRTGSERAGRLQRWDCRDSEEAQFGENGASPVLRRPPGTERKPLLFLVKSTSFILHPLFIFSALRLLASRGRKPVLKDPEWAPAEKPRGVGEGDGENDGRVQQNEDRRTADGLVYGPAEEGERSCKVTSKNILQRAFFFSKPPLFPPLEINVKLWKVSKFRQSLKS